MEKVYEEEYIVRHSQVDQFGRLKLSALLELMQEAAGNHYSLTEENLVWVISRHHVEISRLPSANETIKLETWALPPTRAAFPRATVGYDKEGKELFRSISLWVLIHKDSRDLVLPGKVNLPMVTTVRGMELPNPSSLAPKSCSTFEERVVRYSFVDVNGHMNNARYMDWIDDLIPSSYHENHSAKEFTICYVSEAKLGENIQVGFDLEDDVIQVDAQRNNQRVFSAKVYFENV